MPININFLANTSKLERGTANAERALDDVADSLDDVAREGGRSVDQLERSLQDAGTEARDMSRKIDAAGETGERSFRDLARAARDTKSDLGRVGDEFASDAGKNVESFKDEAVQNLSEVASSFTGDLSQMADGVQGLTGGLASALTPGIGIPVAILGAAAAGFFAQWQEKAEATKQLVSDMYDDMTASGESFLSQDFIQQGIAKAYRDQYDDVKKRAEQLGVDHHLVAQAMAGDEAAINQLLDTRNAKRDAEIRQIQDEGGGWRVTAGKVQEANKQYQLQTGWLDDVADATRRAQGEARDANAATSDYLRSAIRDAGSATEEVDQLGNRLITLPNGKQIMIDAKTGQARSDISQFKGDLDGKVPTRKTTQILANADAAYRTLANLRREASKPIRVTITGEYAIKGNPFRRIQ